MVWRQQHWNTRLRRVHLERMPNSRQDVETLSDSHLRGVHRVSRAYRRRHTRRPVSFLVCLRSGQRSSKARAHDVFVDGIEARRQRQRYRRELAWPISLHARGSRGRLMKIWLDNDTQDRMSWLWVCFLRTLEHDVDARVDRRYI